MRRLTLIRAPLGVLSIFAFLALNGCGPNPASESTGPDRYISTTGEGEVSAVPDRAEIRIGVENEAERAAEALRLNSDAMTAVLKEVSSFGLDQNADVRTLQVSVRPRYERVATTVGGPRRRTLVGYTASNSVLITVRDIEQAPDVLDAMAEAGANRTDSISFYLAEREKLEDEARTKAFADARRKAELLAEQAGMALGSVQTIVENRSFNRYRRPETRLSTTRSRAPIAPGERKVQASLTARWDLVPKR